MTEPNGCNPLARIILWFLMLNLFAPGAWSDAIVRTQAMNATTIAQYFVEDSGVRLELEVGLSEIESFKNLLPDDIYTRVTGETRPLAQRLAELFDSDLYVVADDAALAGQLRVVEPRARIRRDSISGEALPVATDEEPETVIFAEIFFPFHTAPAELTFGKRRVASVGFVLYHQGVAVNDFRYLGPGQRVTFDWDDPWYTSFNSRSLRRTYYAPMSGFLYVEPYEVRKEIIVRPKDLQQWVDLGLAGRETIPVEMQAELKRRVGEFLREHQPVTIDGEAVAPELARINFLARTLTASRVIDPPEELDINSATLGAIFVYPTVEPLPQNVVMQWDLFTEKLPLVPVASVDQAGPLPAFLEPDYAVLEWQNFLRFPDLPSLKAVLAPPSILERAAGYGSWLFLVSGTFFGWRAWSQQRQASNGAISAGLAVALLLVAGGSFWRAPGLGLSQEYASDVVGNLLHNVYRAFDFRSEADVYDVLTRSVAGDLLTDIYLETRRGLVLENQGGARAKVKQIELVDLSAQKVENGILANATWIVSGSVGHWGHLHERRNRYQAELEVQPIDGEWRLVGMEVLQEERL